jgi:CheY-like chemotaxis protein
MKSHLTSPILVASDVAADANLVRKLLGSEFEQVHVSTNADSFVQDFEARKPEVLVLAFNTLQRPSSTTWPLPLEQAGACDAASHGDLWKDDLRRVYELFRKKYFDDYVMFWPLTHDAPRLPMAEHHGLRQLATSAGTTPSVADFAVQARRIAELEGRLAQYAAHGAKHVDAASRSLRQVGDGIGAALDSFSQRVSDGELAAMIELRDPGAFQQEFARLKKEKIDPHLQSAAEAVKPVGQWAGALRDDLAPQLESIRALRQLADQIRPLVLIVDDDEFQQRLLAKTLQGLKLDPIFAGSGSEAMGLLRKQRPNLVLMDIDLPDIDGVEVTRWIKSIDEFKQTPVVMITGHSEKRKVIDSLKAGAADFIVKPIDQSTFMAKVHKLLPDRLGD